MTQGCIISNTVDQVHRITLRNKAAGATPEEISERVEQLIGDIKAIGLLNEDNINRLELRAHTAMKSCGVNYIGGKRNDRY